MANVYGTSWVKHGEELKKSYEDAVKRHKETHDDINAREKQREAEHAEAIKQAEQILKQRLADQKARHAETHADINTRHARFKQDIEDQMRRHANNPSMRDYYEERLKQRNETHDYERQRANERFEAMNDNHTQRFNRTKDYLNSELNRRKANHEYERQRADERLNAMKDYYADRKQRQEQYQQYQQQQQKQRQEQYQQYQQQQQQRQQRSGSDSEWDKFYDQFKQKYQQHQQQQRQQYQAPPKQEYTRPKETMPEGFNFNFNARPHEMLGVKPGATRAEVMTGYKNAMRQYHPDVNPPEHNAIYTRAAQAINSAKDHVLRGLAKAVVESMMEAFKKSSGGRR